MSNLEQKKLKIAEKRIEEREELQDLQKIIGKEQVIDQIHTEGGRSGVVDAMEDNISIYANKNLGSLAHQIGIVDGEKLSQATETIIECREKLEDLNEEQVNNLLAIFAKGKLPDIINAFNIGKIEETNTIPEIKQAKEVYKNIEGEKPQRKAFLQGYLGMKKITETQKITNTRYLTIVDYTKGRSEDRLYVIDLKENKTLFHEKSGHGKKSGKEHAESFSNTHGSNQSSLGFMKVSNRYEKNSKGTRRGLRLHGLEDDINDQSDERGIFMHPGSVAGSLGCVTLPKNSKRIMDTVKGGVIFSYNDDENYLAQSDYLDEIENQENSQVA